MLASRSYKMQSIGAGLWHGAVASRARLGCQSQIASTSRVFILETRRNASFRPLKWIQDTISPKTREKNSAAEIAAAKEEQAKKGQLSVFESLPPALEDASPSEDDSPQKGTKHTQHKYSTANFKISHRKLNMLGRQLSGKSIDYAIMQMMFSEKRASKRIKSMLVVAKDHAKLKGLQEKKLVVSEAWVTKGPNVHKRFEPRGRGHHGIREHPDSRLHVVLREGKTRAELMEEERRRKLKRVVSAGLVREDRPLRNIGPAWAW